MVKPSDWLRGDEVADTGRYLFCRIDDLDTIPTLVEIIERRGRLVVEGEDGANVPPACFDSECRFMYIPFPGKGE